MPWLYVTVRLHDAVVEERICAVTDELWLGDVEGAAVSFPGTRVLVRRLGARLQVQGHWLDVGRALRMRKGPIDVRLEAVAPRPMARSTHWLPDVRLFVATAAMVLLGAWFETALRFVETNPVAVARVQALLEPGKIHEPVSTARPATNLPVQDDEPPEEAPGAVPEATERLYGSRRPVTDQAPRGEHPGGDEMRWPPAVYMTLD